MIIDFSFIFPFVLDEENTSIVPIYPSFMLFDLLVFNIALFYWQLIALDMKILFNSFMIFDLFRDFIIFVFKPFAFFTTLLLKSSDISTVYFARWRWKNMWGAILFNQKTYFLLMMILWFVFISIFLFLNKSLSFKFINIHFGLKMVALFLFFLYHFNFFLLKRFVDNLFLFLLAIIRKISILQLLFLSLLIFFGFIKFLLLKSKVWKLFLVILLVIHLLLILILRKIHFLFDFFLIHRSFLLLKPREYVLVIFHIIKNRFSFRFLLLFSFGEEFKSFAWLWIWLRWLLFFNGRIRFLHLWWSFLHISNSGRRLPFLIIVVIAFYILFLL